MRISEQTAHLLERLHRREDVLGELFMLHRDRLWRMLYVRLDRRLVSRISPDDVLQEAFLDVARRIGEYLANPEVAFYVWLRFLTLQRMQMLLRMHLGTQRRDVTVEVSLQAGDRPFATPESMAGQIVSQLTSPSHAAMRHELQEKLRAALDAMDPVDREVLALRHFEELSNQEVATILGITKEAASKRHLRALKRLKVILGDPTSTPAGEGEG